MCCNVGSSIICGRREVEDAMGNGVSRVLGCFVPGAHDRDRVAAYISEPLDEGLGHSFCYIRPVLDSPHLISPCHSDRFSASLDSEARSGSFRLSLENADETHKPKNVSETSFKSISGASVSANTSTPRTMAVHEQFNSFSNISSDRAAAFESTSSFSALPLQPVPRGNSTSVPSSGTLIGLGSGPLDRGFMSGPLERGFMSGPLERGFLSGPLERSCASGPMDGIDHIHFSAPLAGWYPTYFRRRRGRLSRLVRTVSEPVRRVLSRTISKTSSTLARTQRSLIAPVKFLVPGREKDAVQDAATIYDSQLELGYTSSEMDSRESQHLQWAQGKAGEDRVHVVLSEDHGWLFVGIYDGFNGPDAPDFLMSNLYAAIYRELQGLLWGKKEESGVEQISNQPRENRSEHMNNNPEMNRPRHDLDSESSSQNANEGCGQDETQCSVLVLHPRRSPCEGQDCGCAHVEASVRQDSRFDSAQLDSCGQEEDWRSDKGGEECEECLTHASLHAAGERASMEQNFRSFCEAHPPQEWTGKIPPVPTVYSQAEFFLPVAASLDVGAERCNGSGIGRTELNNEAQPSEGMSCLESESSSVCDKSRHEKGFSEQYSKNFNPGKPQHMWKGRSFFKPRLRQSHMRRNGNHMKLFPWWHDWEQSRKNAKRRAEERWMQDECSQCEHAADHSSILKALAHALETTETEYLEMADKALEENPELALMGSCVLVMLMKDEDVYIMNVGDSRAILACQPNYNAHAYSIGTQDSCMVSNSERIGAGESLLRLELEQIIEETPTELEGFEASHNSSNSRLPAAGLSLSALQLSTDHSTGIAEEVLRIKTEHPDDSLSISNDRVKGILKVTRAFGAGFLKKPRWNNALLEMFRVDYVGATPYISCIPALHHHRLGPNDHFLVLSSDGLYQYLSNQEVVSHVEWFMEKFPDGDPAQHLVEELLFRAAKKAGMDFHELLDIPQGDRRKYHDDVYVMVISLEGRIWRSSG
eukprot:c28452_g1_i2 orf=275-3235(+)